MTVERPGFPIVYLRGYAATMGAIEATVATPYMGFNLGSTKLRQAHDRSIVPFIFESPLVRLMKDEGYVDAFREGHEPRPGSRVPARSVWIFRYYESVSQSLGSGERKRIPEFAAELRALLLSIREHVCGDDAEARDAFRVHLVAHSMGGLIARCYLQNLCVNGVRLANGADDVARNKELQLPGPHLVDTAFTYGTPHNGIDLLGGSFNAPDLGFLDRLHVGNFNREEMARYLDLLGPDGRPRPELNGRVDTLDGRFPPERFFCFIGTNHKDYIVARKGIGPLSDGLVRIENAAVAGAPRAFAHRSHSGDYGLVNSEEGYQNLRRFLFGDVRVDAQLLVDEITLPRPIEELKAEGHAIRANYNIETAARVRGAGTQLTERRVSQGSGILREYDELITMAKPVYLFSSALLKAGRSSRVADRALAFAVEVGVEVPVFEVDRRFWFDHHFEGGRLLEETITFHVRPGGDKTTVRYGLASESGVGEASRLAPPEALPDGGVAIEVALGFKPGAAHPPRPGIRGRLRLVVRPWNA